MTDALSNLREISLQLDKARDLEFSLQVQLDGAREEVSRLSRMRELAIDEVNRKGRGNG